MCPVKLHSDGQQLGNSVTRQDGIMELTVGDGVMDESNETSSPPLRTVLADDCIVWDRR